MPDPGKSSSGKSSSGKSSTKAENEAGINLVVLRGTASGPAEIRNLPSGSQLATLALRVPGSTDQATSAPVAIWEPAKWIGDVEEGDSLVVVGIVRRRFFRTAAGTTSARVEIEASSISKAGDHRRRTAALRRVEAALEPLL